MGQVTVLSGVLEDLESLLDLQFSQFALLELLQG
jgi:hypothetical protein